VYVGSRREGRRDGRSKVVLLVKIEGKVGINARGKVILRVRVRVKVDIPPTVSRETGLVSGVKDIVIAKVCSQPG
jgi:hypothetical protein